MQEIFDDVTSELGCLIFLILLPMTVISFVGFVTAFTLVFI